MEEVKTVEVKRLSQCGSEYVYPVCWKAEIFCAIGKRKTLSPSMLKAIEELGFVIIEK